MADLEGAVIYGADQGDDLPFEVVEETLLNVTMIKEMPVLEMVEHDSRGGVFACSRSRTGGVVPSEGGVYLSELVRSCVDALANVAVPLRRDHLSLVGPIEDPCFELQIVGELPVYVLDGFLRLDAELLKKFHVEAPTALRIIFGEEVPCSQRDFPPESGQVAETCGTITDA